MNSTSCLRISPVVLIAAAMLTLSGCGGGGNVSVNPPPSPSESTRIENAITRAETAAKTARVSSTQATAHCEADASACDAAQTADDQATLAEDALAVARDTANANVAERAAAAAELAARNAADAAMEAFRIANAQPPTGNQPPISTSIPWLFPGSEDSAAPKAEMKNTIEALDGNSAFPETRIYPQDNANLNVIQPDPDVSCCPVQYNPSHSHTGGSYWGYWAHPSLSDDITKIQEVFVHNRHPANESEFYRNSLPTFQRVTGILDRGIFGITFSAADQIDDRRDYGGSIGYPPVSFDDAFGAFYRVQDTTPGGSRVITANARWTGDALGVDIDSATPVFGPASLTVTGSVSPADDVLNHRFRLDITWNNGDTVVGNARGGDHGFHSNATGLYGFGASLIGNFAGPNANEAFGHFNEDGYIGAFGLKRR